MQMYALMNIPTMKFLVESIQTAEQTDTQTQIGATFNRILTMWNSLPANTGFSSLAAFRRAVHSTDLAKFLQLVGSVYTVQRFFSSLCYV